MTPTAQATIRRITGTLVEAAPLPATGLYELALVGHRRLLGEVIRIQGEVATLQVYEDTNGLATGEPVEPTGRSLEIELGPGLLGSILDGLGRPLPDLAAAHGDFLPAGAEAATLDATRRWRFEPTVAPGTAVSGGDVLGTVEERPGFQHRILVPPGSSGIIAHISAGDYSLREPIATLAENTPLYLSHGWRVRQPRPVAERLRDDRPFLTGQRIFDFLFPVAEGGTVAVPGGFGTGKTVIEQSLAKWADADIIVYIGCGERGNEMAEVLSEFPGLTDPRTGRSLMDRTIMVVNTSNMPVAAREASVYLGITLAEYYRDQGCRVALMADSLSRWAEALREISARLSEMPGEEGYPTYLASRLGTFYERAGRTRCLGAPERDGALTLITAISPPGGDFSEPVTQACLRVAGAVWALDPALAHQRHFPAVDWETSYSEYLGRTLPWFEQEGGAGWGEARRRLVELLQRGRELKEIAALVGPDALQDEDRLLLDSARLLRELVLAQSAYSPTDASSPVGKTLALARTALAVHDAAREALAGGRALERLDLAPARRALAALRDAGAAEWPALVAAAEAAARAIPGREAVA
jgi:V/A-type H+-transporting ATPase subunit A